MSLKTNYQKDYGPSKRRFEANTSFGPFEVIDVGSSKVAINIGVLVAGSSTISFEKKYFKSSAKPQDLLGEEIDDSLFLTVEKNDYVCILLNDSNSSLPEPEILAIKEADISKDEYKRLENRLIKLAKIIDVKDVEDEKYLIIKNIYIGNIISEMENFPAFTPILWPVEESTGDPIEEGSEPEIPKAWKCVFVPGYIYLPQTMEEPVPFVLNGVSMRSLPVTDVKDGDEFWLTYEITKNWRGKGTPKFEKVPSIEKIIEASPACEEGSVSVSETPCTNKDGKYRVKIIKFEKFGSGLKPRISWRSDLCIYGWNSCASCGSSSGSNGGDESLSSDSGGGGGSSDSGSDSSSGSSSSGSSNCTPTLTVHSIISLPSCLVDSNPGGFPQYYFRTAFSVTIGPKPEGCSCPDALLTVHGAVTGQRYPIPPSTATYGDTVTFDVQIGPLVSPCQDMVYHADISTPITVAGGSDCFFIKNAFTIAKAPPLCGESCSSSSSGV